MTESNNVKFVEDNGKWLWKRYDENGSVTFRSPLFETEREAREDYEANGGSVQESQPVQESSPENVGAETAPAAPQEETSAGTTAPEGDLSAGNAAPEQAADQANTNA